MMTQEQQTAFLDSFERILQAGLIKICDSAGLTAGELLDCSDIQDKWDIYIKDYVEDAVSEFNDYPDAALGWAAFLGMGVAAMWDRDWTRGAEMSYRDYYGSKGWDDMDEHILRDLMHLNLEKSEAAKISGAILSCSQATMELIRREGIQAQTSLGFYALVRAYGVFFHLGATVCLKRLGYKKVPVNIQSPLS